MKAPRASAVSPHEECDGADSIERFAAKNAISRAQAYKEIAAGRLIARKVASRTIITREDAARWRRAYSIPTLWPASLAVTYVGATCSPQVRGTAAATARSRLRSIPLLRRVRR